MPPPALLHLTSPGPKSRPVARYAIAGVLGVLACTQAPANPEPITANISGPAGAHLDSVLTPYVEELRRLTDNSAAIAIGVTAGGQVVYERVFGAAVVSRDEPAHLETRFHLASVSKPVTAAAVLRLVADSLVSLDAPLVRYLPDLVMAGEGVEQITVEQLLTHTSGMPRDLGVDDWLNPAFGPEALEVNISRARDRSLDFTPGARFSYSNSGYDLLGLLVQRVSGMPFEAYVRSRVLEPAGMNGSTFEKPEGTLPLHWAAPHSYGVTTREWTPFPYSGVNVPSSGLHATVRDMTQWGLLHLARGTRDDAPVIAPELFERMVSPQVETPWGDAMGLGWYLQSHEGRPNIMHLGNDTGFEAAMYIYPEEDISIVVMANRDFARTGRIALATAEILFGGAPKSYTLSARYPFAARLRAEGIAAAIEEWEALRSGATQRYTVDDDDLLTMGAVLENGEQWSEARDVLAYYLARSGDAAYPLRLLGNAHLGLGDTLAAVDAYQDALRVNPDYERGRLALEALGVAPEGDR
jgi:CubicO group peptidase (beta-lactamase class C family)